MQSPHPNLRGRKNSSPFLPAMTGNEWLMNIVMVYEWDMKMGYKNVINESCG